MFSALFFMAAIVHGQQQRNWLVEEASNITIYGTSNVADFACAIASKTEKDTLDMSFERSSEKLVFQKAELRIDAASFDCQNRLITQDFRNTLQVDKYPEIILHFISLDTPTESNLKNHKLDGEVKITIVGVSKSYEIRFEVERKNEKAFYLAGKKKVRFKDFGLKPPQKLAGLVKVEDELEIDFTLLLSSLN
ncbi:YceI family protein [Flammeovirgaceae bacterium SG7u.111]|nr:YceI family protein [Flammeovirgaceae bacterium SG7u.132]WPO37096.1 YceI family protein [Flammeovirgaceae bacterium SG7u.111]